MLRIEALLLCLALPLGSFAQIAEQYDQSKAITAEYTAHWKVDSGTFHLGIEATVSGSTGWIGFGITEAGGMPGADIVYFETNKPTEATDAYALAKGAPVEDDCNDWSFVRGGVVDGKVYMEATRPLKTGDPQDWELIDDSLTPNGHQIIAAWGDSGSIGYHGANRKADAAHLFQEVQDPLESIKTSVPGIQSVDILHTDFPIPSDAITTYEYWCVDIASLLGVSADVALHVVAIEPIIDEDTAAYVHHFTVDGFFGTDSRNDEFFSPGDEYRQIGSKCVRSGQGDAAKVYAWTPGNGAQVFPAGTGLRLLGDGYRSLMIDTHYDNPQKQSGLQDSSGIRLWYTTTLQTHDIGVMQIGDPQVALRGVEGGVFAQLPEGVSQYKFSCTRMTHSFAEGVDEVNVFASMLHMHEKGQRMVSRVLNQQGELIRSDQVQVYDFEQNGMINPLSIGGGFKLNRGDWFEVDCYFKVDEGEQVIFGQGSQEEMCINYVYYFPAQPLVGSGDCNIEPEEYAQAGALFHLFETRTDFQRTFGVSCQDTGFDATGTLPFEGECVGVSACVAAVTEPADCAELEARVADLNACFDSNSCCDRWTEAVALWKTLDGLGSCDYSVADSSCGARGAKKSPANLACPTAVACVETLGLPTECEQVDEAWQDASAKCFADEGCCQWYPYFLETWLYSSSELAGAECGFVAGEWGGTCLRSECKAAQTCVEALGLPTQCSEATEEWISNVNTCFKDEECCDDIFSYVQQAILPIAELASCGWEAEDLISTECEPIEWQWVYDVEEAFECSGVGDCAANVYAEPPREECGFVDALHKCFADNSCCDAWTIVVNSADLRADCTCAGSFGTYCGAGSEGAPGWTCTDECSQSRATLDQCIGGVSDSWLGSCDGVAATVDDLKACFENSGCCEGWGEWTTADIPEFWPHLAQCQWGEATCQAPPELPLEACGASLEACIGVASGGQAPTSCVEIEGIKDAVAGCFAQRACCGSWGQAAEFWEYAFSLDGCDLTVDCVDANLKVATFDVTLPIAEADFGAEERADYIQACAETAGVPAAQVRITSVTATTVRRRLLADGIVVATEVEVPSSTTAAEMTEKMADGLDAALQAQGLPASSSIGTLSVADGNVVATTTPPPAESGAQLVGASAWLTALAALLLGAVSRA